MRVKLDAQCRMLLPSHHLSGDIAVRLYADDPENGRGWRRKWRQHRVSNVVETMAEQVDGHWHVSYPPTANTTDPGILLAIAWNVAEHKFGTRTIGESWAAAEGDDIHCHDCHRNEPITYGDGQEIVVEEWVCSENPDDETVGQARLVIWVDADIEDWKPDLVWQPGMSHHEASELGLVYDLTGSLMWQAAKVDSRIGRVRAELDFLLGLRWFLAQKIACENVDE